MPPSSPTIASIRRYPIKSMGGENLRETTVDRRGISGDRWYAVRENNGRLISGKNTRRFRRCDAVFSYAARTTDRGVVVTDGVQQWLAGEPPLDAELSRAAGAEVHVAPETTVSHQDRGMISIVSTATLGWCAAKWGDADPRRLRTNIVIDATEPFTEEAWVGHDIQVGRARLRVVERTPRCRMMDIAQDGLAPPTPWLLPLTQTRGMYLAVYADVLEGGPIRVGDRVARSA